MARVPAFDQRWLESDANNMLITGVYVGIGGAAAAHARP